jgi:hypothetical protein
MSEDVEIGSNPLPLDAQEKLGEFIDWLDANYEISNGATALYWGMSCQLSQLISETPDADQAKYQQ